AVEVAPGALAEVGDDRGLLLRRAAAQHGAVDAQPAGEHAGQVELAGGAFLHADDDEAAVRGERAQVAVEVLGADDVEHHVDAALAGGLARPLDEVLAAVVDAVGAERLAAGDARGAARGGEHDRAGGAQQLDRGRADAAGAAVHEDG